MKIKKIEPQDLIENKIEYKKYKKILKPALKTMVSGYTSEENATRFFIKTNYEFSDLPGKKMAIIIPGNHTSAWIKMIKEDLKQDKKNTCLGDCFVKKNNEGEFTLVLLPEKGSAKKNLMKKQIEKFAFKGLPFNLEIGAGGELEEDKAEDVILEEIALPDDSIEEVDEDDEDDETNDSLSPDVLKNSAKEIISEFKEIQKQYNSELAILLYKDIKIWTKSFEILKDSTDDELIKFNNSIQKIETHLSMLLKIDKAIDKELEPLYDKIDKHNDMVDRGDNKAEKIKEEILKVFDKIHKYSSEIKDSSLVEIINDFKKELK